MVDENWRCFTANRYKMTKSANLDSVRIRWERDESPDLSFLDVSVADYEAQGIVHAAAVAYARQDRARRADHGCSWWMTGCTAEACVSYPLQRWAQWTTKNDRRLEWFSSGGVWGIESDSDPGYKLEVEAQELNDLRSHLSMFGVDVTNFDAVVSR